MGLTQYKNELLKVTTKEIKRFLGGDHRLFTEERKNSSELQNLSSELSFHSSEVSFHASEEISVLHGAICLFLRGDCYL